MALSQNIGEELAGGPTSAETAIADADRAYALRPELEGIEASIKALAPFVESDPGAAWRIGRACFFLGEQRNARSHKRKYFKHGARVCGIAGSGWPGRAEPIFWGGVNLGLLAEGSRFPLSLAYAIRAARLLNRAADLDPGFHGAGPLRVLARLKHKMPRVAGGGADRARVLYERAIALWPA